MTKDIEREAFATLPEVAKLYQACKERDLTIAEREYLKGARDAWQAAKAQAVLEKDAIIQKLSDQLYAQEMKTSGARVLCETACELLDDYAHQDAMVILNDLEQAMSTGANQ